MIFSEYLVRKLIENGVTDTFGIPGGVILRLLASMKDAEPILTPHLCYHEQAAGFAALGYAQACGRIGVAYATRGPGITNMMTCIAEAYQESIPVIFITAHGSRTENNVRFNNNQELNIVKCVSEFTEFAANAESIDEAAAVLEKAVRIASEGRKGPVLLDFAAALFNKEVPDGNGDRPCGGTGQNLRDNAGKAAADTAERLKAAIHPVLLIGDGVRYSVPKDKLCETAEKIGIPVLSSRGSQDLLGGSGIYFGYVGSHGTRYSNFILSETDLIISVGNRMAFPAASASFAPVIEKAEIIRIDVDRDELGRVIPGETSYHTDAGMFFDALCEMQPHVSFEKWTEKCRRLKEKLENEDCPEPVRVLTEFIRRQGNGKYYVCDVGNNEFWFSRAYERSGASDGISCSKSFGTLGSALCRAIGAYYALKKEIVCITGDQGFQYNIQELQYISSHKLPIKIILLNNERSGMIADHEKTALNGRNIHTDSGSGYSAPDFRKIAECYGIKYTVCLSEAVDESADSLIYEIKYDDSSGLVPFLPKGNKCCDMRPALESSLYEQLNNL